MPLQYSRRDADQVFNMLRDRVELKNAIQFVESLQSHQFGYLLELEAHAEDLYQQHPEGFEADVDAEQELQDDLKNVEQWLRDLNANGQDTISTSKVIDQIEEETGYKFEFEDY
ncbi:hypothetical protein [Salinibaculum rarum]|uniref:hypothetical protein n=1 Tax=Salinibaculum rarum TaxID=3058903 RepID=UPI00265FF241|nr:hypothetical protein [Salinibaculum sp. KK48]